MSCMAIRHRYMKLMRSDSNVSGVLRLFARTVWPSGHSSWLQTQGALVRLPAVTVFWTLVSLEQSHEVN
jgi:hypothetical protein